MTGLTPEAEVATRHARDLTEAILAVVNPLIAEKDELIKTLTAACASLGRKNEALTRENGRLTAQMGVMAHSDDLADAVYDREREDDFAKSEEKQDKGARE